MIELSYAATPLDLRTHLLDIRVYSGTAEVVIDAGVGPQM
jgi:hypothetical protein